MKATPAVPAAVSGLVMSGTESVTVITNVAGELVPVTFIAVIVTEFVPLAIGVPVI